MDQYIIAYDLGTGGNKASLYDHQGRCVAECFEAYTTHYPQKGWHEQRPTDWWNAIVNSTRQLLSISKIQKEMIICCGISGHSLDKTGRLLRDTTPIWSDARALEQADRFFQKMSKADWYQITGNGFPAPLYSVFKIMWYRDHEPEMFSQIDQVIGTKDYINFRLTGNICTDYSYASGSGVYDLLARKYNDKLIKASELPGNLFPKIVPSTEIIGTLLTSVAEELGLAGSMQVVSGGVDNSCMALGARNTREGRVYNALGSSSWIAVTSNKPLIDAHIRPYVFAHIIPGLFTSAVSTFAAGSSFRWVRDQFCRDLKDKADLDQVDSYDLMTAEAASSPSGANHLIFNPTLAGGTAISPSVNIRGAFLGLDLSHTRADVIRAVMEGIALELRIALDALRKMESFGTEMLVVGGGSHSNLWRQILADVYEMEIVKSNIDQQAAALGAAACAAVGVGLWKNFDFVDLIHKVENIEKPNLENSSVYKKIMPIFVQAEKYASRLGDRVAALKT
jgi:xylulokinase